MKNITMRNFLKPLCSLLTCTIFLTISQVAIGQQRPGWYVWQILEPTAHARVWAETNGSGIGDEDIYYCAENLYEDDLLLNIQLTIYNACGQSKVYNVSVNLRGKQTRRSSISTLFCKTKIQLSSDVEGYVRLVQGVVRTRNLSEENRKQAASNKINTGNGNNSNPVSNANSIGSGKTQSSSAGVPARNTNRNSTAGLGSTTSTKEAQNNSGMPSNPVTSNASKSYELKNSDIGIPDNSTTSSGNSNPMTNYNTNTSSSALNSFNKGYQQGQQIADVATGIADLFAPTPAQLQRRAAKAAEVERQERANAEAAEAKANKARLVAGRKNLLSKLSDGKTPLSYQVKDATEVYFFTYSYQAASLEDDAPVIYISNVFSVAKYGDGSWPFKANLIEGIQKTYKGLDLKLSGYYLDKEKAEEQQRLLARATTNYNFKVNSIAYTRKKSSETAAGNTDFWGNPVKEGEQQPKTATEKKPASTTPKDKLDFWGNPVKE